MPLVTTATRLPRAVYFAASVGSCWIAVHAYATPGEYASDRSRWLASALVGAIEIFPGRGNSWYSSAAVRSCSSGELMIVPPISS